MKRLGYKVEVNNQNDTSNILVPTKLKGKMKVVLNDPDDSKEHYNLKENI